VGARLPVSARSTERARRVFTTLPDRYDLLAELLSFGQNARWRSAMVERALADDPGLVVDVATGTAGVALSLTDRSDAEVVGIDISPEMIGIGRRNVAAAGRDGRIALVLARGEALPLADGSADALTFTYLLRYVDDPAATLRELARVVRPGGRVASLEFHVPPNPVWRIAWRGYTRLVLPLAGGLLGGRGWWRVGAFLGPNIDDHYRRYPLAWHVDAWRDAGFDDVRVQVMSLGGGVVMSGRRRG
jgi:demethylmenaquinone methyltransferase / 2-methoxy-6-polyprenyl-1,4-benzoquinol methylase